MIVKYIANPKTQSSKASRIGTLLDYIVADGRADAQKAEYIGANGNFYSDSQQGQRAEMVALAMEATRSKDPVDHWLLSWKEGEQPTQAQCNEAVEILKRNLGMSSGHLAVYALHSNTENYHLHVVLNRVHPETLRVEDKGWCIDKAHKAIAEIICAQGWEAERNARYVADLSGQVTRASGVREPQPRSKARDHENATGEKSYERIAQEKAAPILHEGLDQVDMRYERKGSGAILWVGDQPLKASCIGREFSRIRMEERLGEYQPDSRANSIPPPPCTAEPLRPDMPANWAEYRKALGDSRKEKDAAQVQQRMDHRASREMQSAEFRKERSALYQGGKWSGDALNVARSLLAADHAKRKAELMERQKRERDSLRMRFGRRRTFEQFLVEQGEPQLAEQWRYRDTEMPGAAILGDGDEIPRKRDIRDFTAQVRPSAHTLLTEIHYSSRSDPSRVSFTDRGKRIEVWQAQDEAAVLAALQLGAQKWGTLTITGPDEFKQLCAQLAEQHGFKISNPELRREIVRGPSDGQPVPVIPAGIPPPSRSYQLHKADILNRIEVRNASQLDWMIAVRMRVTGHDQHAITQALKENASQGREAENRNWSNYAERTAEAVFGPRGDRECDRNTQRTEAWARVEGRDLTHVRQMLHSQRRAVPERRRGDFEIE
jgi:Large polyvalent protein-associated domain 7/Relaxase/Mobilisation nuclease domain